jgi:prepilin-type N-terminal cleavage/methylation domain-containing protein
MNHRRAFTLIEMVVVMALASAMLGMAVALLVTLLRAERAVRDHVGHAAQVNRLAEQFRRDAHAAVRVMPGTKENNQSGGVRFELAADHAVTYLPGDGEIVRTQWEGARVRGQDSFSLLPQSKVSWSLPSGSRPAMVSLRIELPGPPAGSVVSIEAVVARDHRFAKQPQEQTP